MMLESVLTSGAAELGITLSEAALCGFRVYADYLADQNALMNLTAIEGEENIARLHFLDSMALFGAADMKGASVIDVGAGAGFPGLVLKLAEPGIRLTLLDSQKKRVDFLERLCSRLGLKDVSCLHMRAEEIGGEARGSFDFAVSRAVAELRVLSELTLPFVRVGGALLAMKGPEPEEELDTAKHAISVLGGVYEETYAYKVPGTDIRHSVVVIKKLAETPGKYPRRFARIQKSPL